MGVGVAPCTICGKSYTIGSSLSAHVAICRRRSRLSAPKSTPAPALPAPPSVSLELYRPAKRVKHSAPALVPPSLAAASGSAPSPASSSTRYDSSSKDVPTSDGADGEGGFAEEALVGGEDFGGFEQHFDYDDRDFGGGDEGLDGQDADHHPGPRPDDTLEIHYHPSSKLAPLVVEPTEQEPHPSPFDHPARLGAHLDGDAEPVSRPSRYGPEPFSPFASLADFRLAKLPLTAHLTRDEVDAYYRSHLDPLIHPIMPPDVSIRSFWMLNKTIDTSANLDNVILLVGPLLRTSPTLTLPAGLCTQFKPHDLSATVDGKNIRAQIYLREMRSVCARLVADPAALTGVRWAPERWFIWRAGERVRLYGEVTSGDRAWEMATAALDGDLESPLFFSLFTDETQASTFSGSSVLYPAIVWFGSVSQAVRTRNSPLGPQVLGLIPILTDRDVEGLSDKSAKTARSAILSAARSRLFDALKIVMDVGYALVDPLGLTIRVRPLLSMLATDLKELFSLLNIRQNRACPVCLEPIETWASSSALPAQARTSATMHDLCQLVQQETTKAKRNKVAQQHGIVGDEPDIAHIAEFFDPFAASYRDGSSHADVLRLLAIYSHDLLPAGTSFSLVYILRRIALIRAHVVAKSLSEPELQELERLTAELREELEILTAYTRQRFYREVELNVKCSTMGKEREDGDDRLDYENNSSTSLSSPRLLEPLSPPQPLAEWVRDKRASEESFVDPSQRLRVFLYDDYGGDRHARARPAMAERDYPSISTLDFCEYRRADIPIYSPSSFASTRHIFRIRSDSSEDVLIKTDDGLRVVRLVSFNSCQYNGRLRSFFRFRPFCVKPLASDFPYRQLDLLPDNECDYADISTIVRPVLVQMTNGRTTGKKSAVTAGPPLYWLNDTFDIDLYRALKAL
ncbi:hypothetical protein Rhopal_004676-T1 [Rhodotorula paludigena]|uniref:C2H2-type domain-containing protein n=1 Tax=Rhodotorula paludigena TaxID=86838 RepID=A0AAV5GN87_9BASI|nr:hypothetical protein Rhopal_004676-T1 [Rhodotorula paludigena]